MENEPPLLFGLRPLLPDPGNHKGTRSCELGGCPKSTREGKPFCSAHIANSPYIRRVQAQLDKAAEEAAILEGGRREISKNGFYVREAVLLLRTRDFTVKSFSRRLDISHKAARRLIDLLMRWGLARENKTTRGSKTISGLGAKDLVDGL